jgi:large subunit ribosomal protein L13e
MVKPRLKYPDVEALRRGRGFSYGEISGVGASVQDVKGEGLPIDRMRRSVHDFNVRALRELLGKSGKEKPTRKAKPKAAAKTPAAKKQEKAEEKKGEKKKNK